MIEVKDNIADFTDILIQNFSDIKEYIKTKGISDINAYTKIIYFINNDTDKLFFTGYFNKDIGKEFTTELNKQLNEFISSGRIETQPLQKTNTITNTLEKLTKDSIVRGIKGFLDKHKTKMKFKDIAISDNEIEKEIKKQDFKDNIQKFLLLLTNCYKLQTNKDYKKTMSSSDNTRIFNIFSRIHNLDAPVESNELIPSKDMLYLFLEKNRIPKVGYFYASDISKNQYTFVLDPTENKEWRTKDNDIRFETMITSTWSEAFKTKFILLNKDKWDITKNELYAKKGIDNNDLDEGDLKEQEDAEEKAKEDKIDEIQKEENRLLVEIKYSFGEIMFKNIQKSLSVEYNNENKIEFYKRRVTYEAYKWFKFNIIDRSLPDITDIKYFRDTIFDVPSLKAFLKEENILKDNTKPRLSYEFLKINNDPILLKKYAKIEFG